ncbi:hypothetical protein B0H11DRAFT_1925396 [Mycena galericulata]|nr:hypothetical protein B0H11DRAFT_1925396 [Mycena galericulata]
MIGDISPQNVVCSVVFFACQLQVLRSVLEEDKDSLGGDVTQSWFDMSNWNSNWIPDFTETYRERAYYTPSTHGGGCRTFHPDDGTSQPASRRSPSQAQTSEVLFGVVRVSLENEAGSAAKRATSVIGG